MFSVHTAPRGFKSATITGHFGFCVWGILGQGKITSSWRHRNQKAPLSEFFLSKRNRKAGDWWAISKRLRFRDGFVWIEGLTGDIRPRFQIASPKTWRVWYLSLTQETKRHQLLFQPKVQHRECYFPSPVNTKIRKRKIWLTSNNLPIPRGALWELRVLSKQHKTMTSVKARTQTARSTVKREVTKPPRLKPQI